MDTRVEIFGTKGSIYINFGKANVVTFSEPGYGPQVKEVEKERPHPTPTKGWSFPIVDEVTFHGFSSQFRHFIDCILQTQNL